MYILSIDQGTTGTTAALICAETFSFIDKVNIEHQQIFPKSSYVEHDLNEIWEATRKSILQLLTLHKVADDAVKCIGITNQRETTCAFSKDGTPLANAIVWQDRRTQSFCENLKSKNLATKIKNKTGLTLDPYFSASKMNWLLEYNEEVKQAAKSNNLRFGTIDTFLLYKLTNNSIHKTDVSNASRTSLMNLDSQTWDTELLEIYGVAKDFLPEICDSIGYFGETKGLDFLPDGIPISGILGDQQSALFGQACFKEGESKCTYGTGAFMLLNTGRNKIYSENGLLTTVAYRYKNETYYALEGSSYIAGAAVQWLRDNLKIIKSASDIEQLASSIDSLDRVKDIFFLPFFTGIGSPHWISDAKAAIIGLSRDSANAEIARATLEGICFSINDLLEAMKSDLGKSITSLKVDGGAVANDLLMQIQSDISGVNIVRPEVIETTAYGAAIAAAIGIELTSFDIIKSKWVMNKIFKTTEVLENMNYFKYKTLKWKEYIKRLY